MMRAVIDKSMLKTLISRVGIIPVEELNISYTDAGWRICNRDSSNIAILDIVVWKESMAFYEYEHYDTEKGDLPQRATLSFKRFIEAVNVLPDDQPVSITDDGDTVSFDAGKFHSRIREGGVFTEVVAKSLPSPDFSFPLNTSDVEKLFVASQNVTDYIVMRCGPEGLSMSVMDETMAGMSYTDSEITVETPIKSNFPLDYVVAALKGMRGQVLVSLADDYPLKVTSNDPFTTVYYLAPRIMDDAGQEEE